MPRFFFLTTSKAENVRASVSHGGWRSAPGVAKRVSEAGAAGPDPVLLLLSARPTGNFAGVARLASPPLPGQALGWEGDGDIAPPFAVEWLLRVDLPFPETEHVRNALDDGRAVRLGRNGQEVAPAAATQIMALLDSKARATGVGPPPPPAAPLLPLRAGLPPPGAAQAMMMPGTAAWMMGAMPPFNAAAGMMMQQAQLLMMQQQQQRQQQAMAAGMPGVMMPGMWAPTTGMLPGPPPGQPPPPQAPGGRGDGRGRGKRDTRPDIIQMSYEEYFETFKRLKAKTPDHHVGAENQEDTAAQTTAADSGDAAVAGNQVQMMDEDDYIEHCRKYTADMGVPFDEAMVRQHYHNMKASVQGQVDHAQAEDELALQVA